MLNIFQVYPTCSYCDSYMYFLTCFFVNVWGPCEPWSLPSVRIHTWHRRNTTTGNLFELKFMINSSPCKTPPEMEKILFRHLRHNIDQSILTTPSMQLLLNTTLYAGISLSIREQKSIWNWVENERCSAFCHCCNYRIVVTPSPNNIEMHDISIQSLQVI